MSANRRTTRNKHQLRPEGRSWFTGYALEPEYDSGRVTEVVLVVKTLVMTEAGVNVVELANSEGNLLAAHVETAAESHGE